LKFKKLTLIGTSFYLTQSTNSQTKRIQSILRTFGRQEYTKNSTSAKTMFHKKINLKTSTRLMLLSLTFY